jgi:hypothetical protein
MDSPPAGHRLTGDPNRGLDPLGADAIDVPRSSIRCRRPSVLDWTVFSKLPFFVFRIAFTMSESIFRGFKESSLLRVSLYL